MCKIQYWFILIGLMIAGCKTNQSSGRLDGFIINEAKAYGGLAQVDIKHKPELFGKWNYSRDQFGTVIQCNNVTFQAVDRFFKDLCGSPNQAGKNAEGQTQWVVPARIAGVSFWYSQLNGGVQITILKPDSSWYDKSATNGMAEHHTN
ncbi:MAG TPA: hypothetical protein VGN23_03025 [Verrucomicrobiae bacterium]|jgi:hypothetical protein